MCGICGIIGERNEELIRRMTGTMLHRGPDGEGYFLDDGISLGMRRLAIIDLKTGDQPVFNEDKTLCVIFNGEIYNFQEIRKELEAKGHIFRTNSDTEVIVHSYEEYGQRCVEKFNGMFAFAIWDRREKSLFIARDRIGIKPLYYTIHNNKFIFASEIKAILEYGGIKKELDYSALDLYLTLQYVPGPLTMFQGIKKLEPGNFLIYKNGRMNIEKYWEIPLVGEKITDLHEAKERLNQLLGDSVRLRLISDVPLGILLSGGIDSSLMVAFASRLYGEKVKTFTVGFGKEGEEYDERPFARKIADRFGTEHHEFTIMPDVFSLLPKLIYHMDEPVADQAALPVYLLCKTAKDYVTVLLTGEGGDELFGGYPKYILHRIAISLSAVPEDIRRKLFFTLSRILKYNPRLSSALMRLSTGNKDDILRNFEWTTLNFSPQEKNRLFNEKMLEKINKSNFIEFANGFYSTPHKEWLDKIIACDIKTWLVDDILMKVDKMSMAASVEARVPLLDYKLVEFAFKIAPELKINGFKTKIILKELLKNTIPADILERRKTAFRIPSSEWLRGDLKGFLKFHFIEKTSSLHEYFDKGYLTQLLVNHLTLKEDNSQRIWNLLCFDIWHKIYLEGTKVEYEFEKGTLMKRRVLNKQLLITWDFPPQKGGIQTLLYSLYAPMKGLCTVIAPQSDINSQGFDALSDIRIIRAGFFKRFLPNIFFIALFWFDSFIKLINTLRNNGIRVIHSGHIRATIPCLLLKIFFKKPYIVWTYALEITDKRVENFTRLLLKGAEKIITISEYTKSHLLELGLPLSKIEILHPPVDNKFLESEYDGRSIRRRYGISNETKIILTVARLAELQRYKGIDRVIEALNIVKRSYNNFVYIVCGDGDLKEYYKKLARDSGLADQILFPGNVSDEELPFYYAGCDLFIMVSREEVTRKGILAEGFGIVFLEANACGKPVIGGRSGGISDAVADGETGILVDPNNVNEIADAILKLLTDEKLAKEMGRKGRERVLKEFTVDVAVNKLRRVIDEVDRGKQGN